MKARKAVAAGMNPMDLKRGIELAVSKVVEDVKKRSQKVKTNAEIAQLVRFPQTVTAKSAT